MVVVQDVFDYLARVFKKEEAKEFKKRVVITYNVGGQDGGTWQFNMENGVYTITPGASISPVTATMYYRDAETFFKLATGAMSGIKGYTTGAFRFSGPRAVLESFAKVFPGGRP